VDSASGFHGYVSNGSGRYWRLKRNFMICTFNPMPFGENEIDMSVEKRNACRVLLGNLIDRGYLEDVKIGWRVILK
jgi:hypothetical protein